MAYQFAQRNGFSRISDLYPEGATNFYKCASVNSSGTWTGYKAVWNSTDSKYEYESSLTSDSLTFDSNKNTPTVNNTYSSNALIKAELWEGDPLLSDLVFYAPLTSSQSTASTGQTLNTVGTPVFTTDSGKACVQLDGSNYIYCSDVGTSAPTGTSARTLSVWMKSTSSSSDWYASAMYGYGGGSKNGFGIYEADTGVIAYSASGNLLSSSISASAWHHVAVTFENGTTKLYVDGTLSGTLSNDESNILSAYLGIGAELSSSLSGACKFVGYVSHVRLYTGAKDQAFITKLYQELA